MNFLIYIVISVLLFLLLWVAYLAVMNLKRSRDMGTLTKTAYAIAMIIYVPGYLLDGFVNWFVCTILFLEIPREFTVTSRLSRHCGEESWRGSLAHWFCYNLLDPFDPDGKHCDCDKN